MRVRLLAVLAMLSLIAAACSSEEPSVEPADTGAGASPTETATPPETGQDSPAAAPATPTPAPAATSTPLPTLPLPPFDLADYANGDEIAEFMEGLGEERPFPAELYAGAPELPEEEVTRLVSEFLADSRVVYVLKRFRDTNVDLIVDYCDNELSVVIYLRPDKPRSVGEFTGAVNPWSVEHTEITEWNRPYIAGDPFVSRLVYFTRGWDGVGAPIIRESDGPGLARISGDNEGHVRVFSNPDCSDPQVLTEADPLVWNLLNVGEAFEWPEELEPASPQLDPETVERTWKEAFRNVLVFDNLNGFPSEYVCGDRGVVVGRWDIGILGEPYTFTLEDASDVYPNSAIFYRHFDNADLGIGQVLTLLPEEDQFFQQIFAVELTDCSIEEGVALAENVRAELER